MFSNRNSLQAHSLLWHTFKLDLYEEKRGEKKKDKLAYLQT
jgi:hypothetical protein